MKPEGTDGGGSARRGVVDSLRATGLRIAEWVATQARRTDRLNPQAKATIIGAPLVGFAVGAVVFGGPSLFRGLGKAAMNALSGGLLLAIGFGFAGPFLGPAGEYLAKKFEAWGVKLSNGPSTTTEP